MTRVVCPSPRPTETATANSALLNCQLCGRGASRYDRPHVPCPTGHWPAALGLLPARGTGVLRPPGPADAGRGLALVQRGRLPADPRRCRSPRGRCSARRLRAGRRLAAPQPARAGGRRWPKSRCRSRPARASPSRCRRAHSCGPWPCSAGCSPRSCSPRTRRIEWLTLLDLVAARAVRQPRSHPRATIPAFYIYTLPVLELVRNLGARAGRAGGDRQRRAVRAGRPPRDDAVRAADRPAGVAAPVVARGGAVPGPGAQRLDRARAVPRPRRPASSRARATPTCRRACPPRWR